jgi:hypothetical protein
VESVGVDAGCGRRPANARQQVDRQRLDALIAA